ncbi:DNA-binding transcriptional MerR regulator [Aminobacter aminovorans]|uniref:Multidrug transporter activation protein n=1 Tax=Aminobacter aminovorans TaxID=83263 RepID=A0A380WIL1_AMIAI|nr:MerR family transcriptional regulator [Aminobacter aminovorans]TCS28970.1 DNA-binding transcriptional MerR regulator [Aminobacter aminovorans]SUU88823.1 Multidrug transporter activation protein [Aminobacter aminovorans]
MGDRARLAGVTIRTLHHYHDIGLLKLCCVGTNGYRCYGEEELLRLQQVLIHRELGIPLGEIAAILNAPGFDRLAAPRQQRGRLEAEASRYRRLVNTIDHTIAKLEGDRVMNHAGLV